MAADAAALSNRCRKNRDFKVLLSSQGISSLGDAVSFTALPLLVLALTGSGLAMGVVAALQTLPDLVFGMVAGATADRSDRKRMMFLADLGRAGLTALIPLSVALDGPTMAVILIVAAPTSILRSFFLAGYTASVPALVGRSQVGRANSYFEAIYSIGLHPGAGDRRHPRGHDRARPDARHRRHLVRAVRDRAAVRAARPPRPDRPAPPAAADRDPRGHRLHPRRPDAARDHPVLGRHLDPDLAARHRARRADHQGPRPRAVDPRAAPGGLRRRDRRRVAADGPDDRSKPSRRRPARRQPGDGPRAGRSSRSRTASRSCSGPRSSRASRSRWSS